jgi:hypothetical protein
MLATLLRGEMATRSFRSRVPGMDILRSAIRSPEFRPFGRHRRADAGSLDMREVIGAAGSCLCRGRL